MGGYGIYVDGLLSIGVHLPPSMRQNNNTAEIFAAVQALKAFPEGKVAICTDSALVFLGATGKARKWALNNWVGSRGPLSNVGLWTDLLSELELHQGEVTWVKIPLHVGIQGNEEADSLAERGRLSSPLLANSLATSARETRHSVSPQREHAIASDCISQFVSISDSDSDTPPPLTLEDADIQSRPLHCISSQFDTFAPDHIPTTPATPVQNQLGAISPLSTQAASFQAPAQAPNCSLRWICICFIPHVMNSFMKKSTLRPVTLQHTHHVCLIMIRTPARFLQGTLQFPLSALLARMFQLQGNIEGLNTTGF